MEFWKETAQLEASCLAVGGCTEASRTTQTGEKSHYEEMSQREPWRRPVDSQVSWCLTGLWLFL